MRTDCLRCHHDKQAFCDKCHGFPPPSHYSGSGATRTAPTPRPIPRTARPATTRPTARSATRVNHPPPGCRTHGGIAAKGPSACLVCHPQGMCDACHEQNGVTP